MEVLWAPGILVFYNVYQVKAILNFLQFLLIAGTSELADEIACYK